MNNQNKQNLDKQEFDVNEFQNLVDSLNKAIEQFIIKSPFIILGIITIYIAANIVMHWIFK